VSAALTNASAHSSNHLIQPIAFLIKSAHLIFSIAFVKSNAFAHLDKARANVGRCLAKVHHQASINNISGIKLPTTSGQYSHQYLKNFLTCLCASCQSISASIHSSSVLINCHIVAS